MAGSNRIADALEVVSCHLEAIELLGRMVAYVQDGAGQREYPYDFCLAFQLLAEAARGKLDVAAAGVDGLIDEAEAAADFRADPTSCARCCGSESHAA